MKCRVLVLALVLCGLSTVAFAQTGAVASAQVQYFSPGVDPATGAPVQTTTFVVTAATCNQAPVTVPNGTAMNPKRVVWDDAANAGKVCIVDQAATLVSLPIVSGAYVATMTTTDDRGLVSPRSAASNPFTRALAPTAPKGVKVVP